VRLSLDACGRIERNPPHESSGVKSAMIPCSILSRGRQRHEGAAVFIEAQEFVLEYSKRLCEFADLMATASARIGLALSSAPEPNGVDLSNLISPNHRALAVRS